MIKYKLIAILIIFFSLSGCLLKQGNLTIVSKETEFEKITVNGEEVLPQKRILSDSVKYKKSVEYGKIVVELFSKDGSGSTKLEFFHENSWYQSVIKISGKEEFIYIEYREHSDIPSENIKVRRGETVRYSWM